MEPLNLRERPPRGPRVRLAGLVFGARAVDKIRGSLPGGDLAGYFTDIGVSAAWSHYTGIPLDELREIVQRAASEEEVEQWIARRTEHLDRERFNAKMESLNSSRIPDAWREAFDGAYPAELVAAHPVLFDLIEADDALARR